MGNLEEVHIQALASHHTLAEGDTGPQVAGRYDNPLDSFSFPAIMKTSKAAHVVEVGLHTESTRLEEEDKTCLEKNSWGTGGDDGDGGDGDGGALG